MGSEPDAASTQGKTGSCILSRVGETWVQNVKETRPRKASKTITKQRLIFKIKTGTASSSGR